MSPMRPSHDILITCMVCRRAFCLTVLILYFMCRSRAQSLPVPTGANGEVSTQESIVPGMDFANHAVDHSCRWTMWGGQRVSLPCQPLSQPLSVGCAGPHGPSCLP